MALINKKMVQNNWRLITAVGLTALAALVTGLTCAFFPPAIPAIAGISIFGAKIFAGLSTMSVVAASFSAAGIGAATALISSFAINALTAISNLLDSLIRGKTIHVHTPKKEPIVEIKDGEHQDVEQIVVKNPFTTPELAKPKEQQQPKEMAPEQQPKATPKEEPKKIQVDVLNPFEGVNFGGQEQEQPKEPQTEIEMKTLVNADDREIINSLQLH